MGQGPLEVFRSDACRMLQSAVLFMLLVIMVFYYGPPKSEVDARSPTLQTHRGLNSESHPSSPLTLITQPRFITTFRLPKDHLGKDATKQLQAVCGSKATSCQTTFPTLVCPRAFAFGKMLEFFATDDGSRSVSPHLQSDVEFISSKFKMCRPFCLKFAPGSCEDAPV